ncbi:hypothetical protein [Paeniglutamicibacter kerguelensis]|uniref:Uncharacterized protein n=1 Tax=Paeniglutamicibacter kerguelensis TaxID=254788 RepID=A0ABS4XHU4_9MICC|nr:hypothetical protein [Paeniglutamicibacter kerguelensis]MBP2387234.1 hypothetical protein [Paeniglutamicibacter kerguelensis]
MKWNNLLAPASGLLVAIIVIATDLPAPRAILVMAVGFGVALVADLAVARRVC